MPDTTPVCRWSPDTAETIPAAIWLGKTLIAGQLDDAYQRDRQAVADCCLRVISGIHEMTLGRPLMAEDSSAECEVEAVSLLAEGLGIQPPAAGPGSILLQLILQELLHRLAEFLSDLDDA